jgi:hypothetical protein
MQGLGDGGIERGADQLAAQLRRLRRRQAPEIDVESPIEHRGGVSQRHDWVGGVEILASGGQHDEHRLLDGPSKEVQDQLLARAVAPLSVICDQQDWPSGARERLDDRFDQLASSTRLVSVRLRGRLGAELGEQTGQVRARAGRQGLRDGTEVGRTKPGGGHRIPQLAFTFVGAGVADDRPRCQAS